MARRGMERFIRDVTSMEELPAPVSDRLREVFAQDAPRLVLFVPSQEYPIRRTGWLRDLAFGWRKTPPRTVAFGGDRIVVIEDHDGSPQVYDIPLLDLIQMDIVTELLSCYVALVWAGRDGPQQLRIEFNSVNLRLMERGLSWVRAEIAAMTALPALPESPSALAHELPFKFRSYLAISLLPGELTSAVVFQPRIRSAGARWPKYVTADCAYALTDSHLIMIRDALRTRRAAAGSYLIERHYVMRRQVLSLTLEPEGDAVWHVLKTGRSGTGPELRWLLTDPQGTALADGMTAWLL